MPTPIKSSESPCSSKRSYAIQPGGSLNIPLSFPTFVSIGSILGYWIHPQSLLHGWRSTLKKDSNIALEVYQEWVIAGYRTGGSWSSPSKLPSAPLAPKSDELA